MPRRRRDNKAWAAVRATAYETAGAFMLTAIYMGTLGAIAWVVPEGVCRPPLADAHVVVYTFCATMQFMVGLGVMLTMVAPFFLLNFFSCLVYYIYRRILPRLPPCCKPQ